MEDAELILSSFYLLICVCFIYPPPEFVSAGITTERLFENFIESDKRSFIRHHQHRTLLTISYHLCLPGIYSILRDFQFYDAKVNEIEQTFMFSWRSILRLTLLLAAAIPLIIYYWTHENWRQHPISKSLQRFSNNRNGHEEIGRIIDLEFLGPNVLILQMNAINRIIITDNWIMKTSPYTVYFAHQSHVSLHVEKSETYQYAPQNMNETLQKLSIMVKSTRDNVPEFRIRINALDFQKLQDRVNRSIAIPSNVQFHRTVIDRFIDVFKQQVSQNPIYSTTEMTESSCFACMIAQPNVKLRKQCSDIDVDDRPLIDQEHCGNCNCRPMWCVECLARWFAARHSELAKEFWLQQKCTCPLCRTKFCILDVCYIEQSNQS